MKQVNEINLADNSVGAIVQRNGYRGDGLRAWKEDKDGNRTYFYYDGEMLLGMVTRSAAGEVGQPVQMMWGADGLCGTRWRDVAGREKASYTVWDVQGNLAFSYDERGQIGAATAFTAYGSSVPDANGQLVEASFGYGGKFGYLRDDETGLVLCTYRFYDPSQGRWTQRDPISYQGGQNLYGYVGGDPVNLTDPSGLYEVSVYGNDIKPDVSKYGWTYNILKPAVPGTQYLYKPSKRDLIRELLRADGFYFWGHGKMKKPGRIIINDKGETLTLSDIRWIAKTRKQAGIAKMTYVTLDACFTASKSNYVNAWLGLTETFQGVPGLTWDDSKKGIRGYGKRLRVTKPIFYEPGQGVLSKNEAGKSGVRKN